MKKKSQSIETTMRSGLKLNRCAYVEHSDRAERKFHNGKRHERKGQSCKTLSTRRSIAGSLQEKKSADPLGVERVGI